MVIDQPKARAFRFARGMNRQKSTVTTSASTMASALMAPVRSAMAVDSAGATTSPASTRFMTPMVTNEFRSLQSARTISKPIRTVIAFASGVADL